MANDADWERVERMNPWVALSVLGVAGGSDAVYGRACRVIEDMPDDKVTFRGVPVERFDKAQLVKLIGWLHRELSQARGHQQ